jgi:hypothetical protein
MQHTTVHLLSIADKTDLSNRHPPPPPISMRYSLIALASSTSLAVLLVAYCVTDKKSRNNLRKEVGRTDLPSPHETFSRSSNANSQKGRSLRDGTYINITKLLEDFSREHPEYLNKKPDYFQTDAPKPSAASLPVTWKPLALPLAPTTAPVMLAPVVVSSEAPAKLTPQTTLAPISSTPVSLAPTTITPASLPPTTITPASLPPATITPTSLPPITPISIIAAPLISNPLTLVPTKKYVIMTTSPVTPIIATLAPVSLNSSSTSANSVPNYSNMPSPPILLPETPLGELPSNIIGRPLFVPPTQSNWPGSTGAPPSFETSFVGLSSNMTGRPPFNTSMTSNGTESISAPVLSSNTSNVSGILNTSYYPIMLKTPQVSFGRDSERRRKAPNTSATADHSYTTASISKNSSVNNGAQSIKNYYLLSSLVVGLVLVLCVILAFRYYRARIYIPPSHPSHVSVQQQIRGINNDKNNDAHYT